MAKKDKAAEQIVVELKPDAVAEEEVDYSAMTLEELLEAIGKAYAARNMRLMGQLSRLFSKKEAEAEKAKKDALLAELAQTTSKALGKFTKFSDGLVETGEYDGAEGFWFAYDFGAKVEPGINPSCKLVKGVRKAASEGGSSGKSSYVKCDVKSEVALKEVGDRVYLEKDTEVTIDKVNHTLPAGMTFQQAYDFSANGGWRNRVRMALLKEAGYIS